MATPATPPAAAKKDTRTKHVVANGRSVRTAEGHFGPGKTVLIEPAEAQRLYALGFIVGPDGSALVPGADGPAVNVENGVQIKPKG